MEEERDLTGAALIAAADHVVKLIEQEEAVQEWMTKEFYNA